MTSDAILLLNHAETIVWRIPELKPLDQDPTPTTNDNIFLFPSLLGRGNMKMAHWGALNDWYWNKRDPFLDVFSKTSPGGKAFTMTRYKLTSSAPQSIPVTQSSKPSGPSLTFHQALAFDLDISNPTLQYRYCEGDLVACSISKDVVLGYVSISGKDPGSFAHVKMKLEHEMNGILDYSVCPLAGRICYVTDENEIEVADLFSGIY